MRASEEGVCLVHCFLLVRFETPMRDPSEGVQAIDEFSMPGAP